jgi:hypothetical protein
MLVFQSVICLDYIGHHNFASSGHLQMTVKQLRHLTLKFSAGRGVTVDGNPDMLFDKCLAVIPLLPATHVNSWGINLFTQFWNALGDELTRRITQLPRHINIQSLVFDLTTMTTKNRQMTALHELRSLAVASWNYLQDDKRSMRTLIREVSVTNRSSNHVTEAATNISSAEATIQRYASDDPGPPSSAVQTNHQFPSSTAPGAPASDFPSDFRGCLGCGGDHVFRSCPMREDPATVDRFHKNFDIKFYRPQNSGPLLFQEILQKVGMCGLIVVEGSTFYGVFSEACALLGIHLHAASRGNHKAVSVERFFRCLNKAVIIASSDRGTHLV